MGLTDSVGLRPVVQEVQLELLSNKQVSEEFAQERVVRLVLEAQGLGVVQEGRELDWVSAGYQAGPCRGPRRGSSSSFP